MAPITQQRLAFIFATLGLVCPVTLILVITLLRQGVISFHDDFTGYQGIGFFLVSVLCLLPVGLLSSSIALVITRQSRLAWVGVIINAGLFAWGFLLFG